MHGKKYYKQRNITFWLCVYTTTLACTSIPINCDSSSSTVGSSAPMAVCAHSSQSCTLHYNMVQQHFPTDEGNGTERRTWMDEGIVQLYKNKQNTPTWMCNTAVPTHGHTHHVCTRLTGVSPKTNVMHGGTTMRKSVYSYYYTVYLVHLCHFLNTAQAIIITLAQ